MSDGLDRPAGVKVRSVPPRAAQYSRLHVPSAFPFLIGGDVAVRFLFATESIPARPRRASGSEGEPNTPQMLVYRAQVLVQAEQPHQHM